MLGNHLISVIALLSRFSADDASIGQAKLSSGEGGGRHHIVVQIEKDRVPADIRWIKGNDGGDE